MKKLLALVSKEENIPIATLRRAVYENRLPGQKDGRDIFIFVDDPLYSQFMEKYRQKKEKK